MRNKAKLKKVFQEASTLVEDLPESISSKAFEIAVAQLLDIPVEKEPTGISVLSRGTKRRIQISPETKFFGKMSKELGIEEEQLKTVYKLVKGNDVKVILQPTGNNANDQRRFSLLYLLAKKVGYGVEWVPALSFAKQAKAHSIYDSHISKNLSKERTILQTGRARGKEYGLTPAGEARAKELLKEIIEHD